MQDSQKLTSREQSAGHPVIRHGVFLTRALTVDMMDEQKTGQNPLNRGASVLEMLTVYIERLTALRD